MSENELGNLTFFFVDSSSMASSNALTAKIRH